MTPQPSIRPTRIQTLIALAVALSLLSWAVVSGWYGDIPPFEWFMPVGIGLVAAGELFGGRVLKRRIEGTDGAPPPDPLVAARVVVLGKASAYLGAGFAGLWAGAALYPASQWGYLLSAKTDTVVALVGVALSVALTCTGLWLESITRIKASDDDDRGPR
ncbi:DUF3180 family protein [Epidermidibacterium keratini]|uniref:DUF3180 family protein n=1 Tax=Epidermidibacterium keratini TaxID=1891644 RepID=A0A7L4YQ18_9ACTN|nr:DUF3180 domain-containing protein [Epidermidibacterium keratini]QHC01003.1 DUF3180 family protein [Epidermidibacterium keratini]